MPRSLRIVGASVLLAILVTVQGAFAQKPASHPKAPPAASQSTIPSDFHGVIKLDVRDSKPDWTPFLPPKAPKGAPNVLFILYDDTGLAAWAPFGGRIQMPTLQRLADGGLRYSQWHTTSLCSPTRSTLLTGRNHHLNGAASIAEGTNGFPGWSCRLPAQCATMAEILQGAGWSTFWVGKSHNVPGLDLSSGGTKRQWPLQMGFDRFYGFLGGETNQYYPALVEGNQYIEPPYTPEQGYHLSKDLADHAIAMIKDQQSANPSKPWYMWYCPGADHAPHQAPQEYIDRYKGKFDDGYEAYRTWALERMVAKGVLPKGTKLTPLNPLPQEAANALDFVRPWDSLSAQEKKLFSRMAEVFAGYSEYTDAQVGRVIDYLQKSGQLDNTLVIYAADNGTSGEGTPNGSVNENKFFNGWPDDMAENMKHYDKLGSPDTYNHFPTGWAAAFSTPFQMFKRYSQFEGGTADPLVMFWPKGIKARGEVRDQYHHSVDIVPTILDVCGVKMPAIYKGVRQFPLSGISMRYTFAAKPHDPTRKKRQYYEMLGTRGMWEDGWMVASVHAPLGGKGHFDKDRWELYHLDVDRSQAIDLAKQHPEKVKHLVDAWFEEAKKNNVLPLDDRGFMEQAMVYRPTGEPPRQRYMYYPDAAPVPEVCAVSVRGRSYKILANVQVGSDCSGVIFSLGSRFGGHTLFIKEHKLYYVYNFLGIQPEQTLVSEALAPGRYTLGLEFTREKAGPHGESIGTAKLYVNDGVVGQGPMRTQPGNFTLVGDGLGVGYDSCDAVTKQYPTPSRFRGGVIDSVCVTVEPKQYIDIERDMQRLYNGQ